MLSKYWTFLLLVLAFCMVFWLPIYFLWNTIVDLFHDIPSNHEEFRRLFELEHWMLFYIFACVILLYMALRAFWVIPILLSLSEKSNIWVKILFSILWLLLFVSLILPILSYFIIWNNLYSDFHFSFVRMLNYVGVLELYILFVVIFEAFILDIPVISFFTRIWMYGYLLYIFW